MSMMIWSECCTCFHCLPAEPYILILRGALKAAQRLQDALVPGRYFNFTVKSINFLPTYKLGNNRRLTAGFSSATVIYNYRYLPNADSDIL